MSPSGTGVGEGAFDGVGRVRLRYRSLEVQQPRAALLVIHGLGEHAGRYQKLAAAMAASGVSTYMLDLRGHGLSEGRRGHAARFHVLLQDVDRFQRQVSGLVDGRLPLFLLGHSMGGLVALAYIEEYDAPLRGGILLAPWLGTSAAVPRWKTTMAGVLNRFLPALPFGNGIDPDALSRDPAVVRAYRDDPLVHDRITPRLFTEASVAMGAVQRRGERIHTPLLIMVPTADRIVDAQRTLAFARTLSVDDVTVREYPGHYHELLNEPDQPATLREIRDWLVARTQ